MIKKTVALSMLMISAVYADYVMTYQMEDEKQIVMYKDAQHVKVISLSGTEESEMYRIGDKVYILSKEDGEKKVIDVDEMKAMAASMGVNASDMVEESMRERGDYTIKKSTKRVNVGGIEGYEWRISGTNPESGEKEIMDIVVTKDKRVAKVLDGMMGIFAKMSDKPQAQMKSVFEVEKGYVVVEADGMILQKFEEKSVPASSYELPNDATMQKMPDLGAMFGGGATNRSGSQSLGACYTQVCCGKTAGASQVLYKMLKERSGGYELQGSGVCDALGIASVFGQRSVEGALYKKGDDAIQVTLNLDDSSGGSVKGQKEMNSDMIKEYKKGVIGNTAYHYAIIMPVKQQTLDLVINSSTTLSVTRLAGKSEIDLISWSKRTIDLDAFEATNASKPQAQDEDTSLDTDAINKNVDDAVNMLKSLF